MEAMLIRILTVRELHLRTKKDGGIEQKKPDDPPFIPDEEEDEDSEWWLATRTEEQKWPFLGVAACGENGCRITEMFI